MKFSIIVPVYNVEKYIEKCLESILKQTYKNYEVIIVNDGSPDNSQKIIDKFIKKDKRFKSYKKENGGLSDARNYGLKFVSGDYILFIDSDDYINKDLLEELNKTINNYKVDLIRFSCTTVDEDGKIIGKENNSEYENIKPELVVRELITRNFVETACLYCYKKDFWDKYKFTFAVGKLHEDYGLIPLVIYFAKNITSINYLGYYYVQRENSITKTINYKKVKKGVYDMYDQYLDLVDILSKKQDNIIKKTILSYISECAIIKGRQLNEDDLKEYIKLLKKDKVVNNIDGYNIKKKIKKVLATISIKLYMKLLG